MKSLLLHVGAETLDVDRGPASYALEMAHALDARLRAPVFQLDVVTPPFPTVQLAAESVAAVESHNEMALAKASVLQAKAHRQGVALTVETERAMCFGVVDWLCDLAMLHDITVSGVDESGLLSERQLTQSLLFGSGRPVLVVPRGHSRGFRCDKVVIAWDYTAPAARAVAEAMPLLRRATDVILLVVGDDKKFGTSLKPADVAEALERRGIHVRVEQRPRGGGRIGDVLQTIALQERADLLVMGAYGHSRLAQFILGGATRRVLDNLQLPVLLSH